MATNDSPLTVAIHDLAQLIAAASDCVDFAKRQLEAEAADRPVAPPPELCKDDAHVFGDCKTCGMPYLASRLEPPTPEDIAWAKESIRRQAEARPVAPAWQPKPSAWIVQTEIRAVAEPPVMWSQVFTNTERAEAMRQELLAEGRTVQVIPLFALPAPPVGAESQR